MALSPCERCGQEAAGPATICPNCGHPLKNGFARRLQGPVQKPPPPPELEGCVFEKMTPEIEALLGPFNMEEFIAEVRKIEETGGLQLEDFIGEIEEIVNRRD
jgi:hypothetical protein